MVLLADYNIRNQLKIGGQVYQDLNNKIGNDLDQRTIYQQVQFCLTGDCSGKKGYFIADFVLVKVAKDENNEDYLDIVIADTKLSRETDFTVNQISGMGIFEYSLKSIPFSEITPNPINKTRLDYFENSRLPIRRKLKFYKIYSGGTSTTYGGID